MRFRARAEYLTSLVHCLISEYGVEIGRIGKAEDMCKEGLTFIGGGSSGTKLHGPIMLGNVRSCTDSLLQAAVQRKSVLCQRMNPFTMSKYPMPKRLENTVGKNAVVLKEEEKELTIEFMPERLGRSFSASLPKF